MVTTVTYLPTRHKLAERHQQKASMKSNKRVFNDMNHVSDQRVPAPARHASNANTTNGFNVPALTTTRQQKIIKSVDTTNAKTVDMALADLFYDEILPFALVRTARLTVCCCHTHAARCTRIDIVNRTYLAVDWLHANEGPRKIYIASHKTKYVMLCLPKHLRRLLYAYAKPFYMLKEAQK
eukprot:6182255-Pleurochrysis_carterae.AAC.5